ncbi:MAG: PHP domain-containing protein [Clostridium sp.]|nr:PHP domain-containing protein [Clostridium sp.]
MDKGIFHVHTYRCRHAGEERDEMYVIRAMELGAKYIAFTDHAPFPNDPFENRMRMDELEDYITALSELKEKYASRIDIKTGLEIEYLPSYQDYYRKLYLSNKFDILMLGQHFYELEPGKYSFCLPHGVLVQKEADGCINAMLEGMKLGYFQVIAHPDRIFRRCGMWNAALHDMAHELIQAAAAGGIYLEQNLSSLEKEGQYRKEFWDLVSEDAKVVVGIDAHAVAELDRIDYWNLGRAGVPSGSGNGVRRARNERV